MTGRSEPALPLTSVLWSDATIDGLEVSYDEASILMTDSLGRAVRVETRGYIGIEFVGAWDESVVESGEIIDGHAFATRCEDALTERFGDDLPESGSPMRNSREVSTLVVTLSDGAEIVVAAADFSAVVVDR